MRFVVSEMPIAPGSEASAIQMRVDGFLKNPANISCKVEQRDGQEIIVAVFAGNELLKAAMDQGRPARELFAEQINAQISASNAALGEDSDLGALSREHESRGDPGAFGRDRNGGPSYGLYQFSSRMGSVAAFLEFLETTAPAMHSELIAAGGDVAARKGTKKFRKAWAALAGDPKFAALQHGYVKRTYYDVFVDHVKSKLRLDIDTRHKAVKDVAWSTAVQHGMKNSIFERALKPILPEPPSDIADEQIINAVYDERSKVEQHFSSSTAKVKNSVKRRFVKERKAALGMLKT